MLPLLSNRECLVLEWESACPPFLELMTCTLTVVQQAGVLIEAWTEALLTMALLTVVLLTMTSSGLLPLHANET